MYVYKIKNRLNAMDGVSIKTPLVIAFGIVVAVVV